METPRSSSSSKIRHSLPAGIPPSPRMRRSGSGILPTSISPPESVNRASSVSLPDIQALETVSPQPSIRRGSRSANTSPRPSLYRSSSTTKARKATKEKVNEDENCKSRLVSRGLISPSRKSFSSETNVEQSNNAAKLLKSSSYNNIVSKRAPKALTRSPSAWALSPGRPFPAPPLAPDSPKVKIVSGVLKYFNKQKKVSAVEEEEFHQYRLMYNRLLQWRFVNAKAEVACSNVKAKAEGRLFAVWLKLYKMRYTVAEKRMKVERLKQKIKLLDMVCPQLELLYEWEKLEKKNSEAVSRVTRKLSAFATKLPLVDGAMADIVSLFQVMKLALEVMEDIEDTVLNFHVQAKQVSNLLKELIQTVRLNNDCFEEVEKEIATIMSLESHEKSLVVHLLQASVDQEEGRKNCKHHLMRSFKSKETRLTFSTLKT